jgi:5-methylcytosine-specific restriction protein A
MMHAAERVGMNSLEVEAGDLHQRGGGDLGQDHSLSLCCQVMRAEVDTANGDAIISAPPSGQEASLKISYRLPRGEFVDL